MFHFKRWSLSFMSNLVCSCVELNSTPSLAQPPSSFTGKQLEPLFSLSPFPVLIRQPASACLQPCCCLRLSNSQQPDCSHPCGPHQVFGDNRELYLFHNYGVFRSGLIRECLDLNERMPLLSCLAHILFRLIERETSSLSQAVLICKFFFVCLSLNKHRAKDTWCFPSRRYWAPMYDKYSPRDMSHTLK